MATNSNYISRSCIRAIKFSGNFGKHTIVRVSFIMQMKKRTASLYLSVAILIFYYYRISLSYFFFFCRNHIVMIFSAGRKGSVKNYFMFIYNYIKIEINIFAREHAFSIYKIFLRIGLSVPLFSSFTRKDTFAFRVHSRMQRE